MTRTTMKRHSQHRKSLPIDGNAILVKGVYNRIIKDYGLEPLSFKITTYNDAPAGSGLGTSSTMVVTILKAFIEWLGLPLGDYELARLAYEIERKDLGLAGGKQDQYASSLRWFQLHGVLEGRHGNCEPFESKTLGAGRA